MKNALIVEDDVVQLIIMELFLGHLGFKCEVFTSCKKAQERLEEFNDFDLILCDVNLPDGDGFEFLGDARYVSRQSTILLATSGDSIKGIPGILQRMNLDGFIDKPFDDRDLEKVIIEAETFSEKKIASHYKVPH